MRPLIIIFFVLATLFALVLISGCTLPFNSQKPPPANDTKTNEIISIEQFTITPSTAYAGDPITIKLKVTNRGNLPAALEIGHNGRSILSNYCPDIFEIKRFSALKNDYTPIKDTVELDNQDNAFFEWQLVSKRDIVSNVKCDVETLINFRYDVTAYRQIQIKKNSEIPDAVLDNKVSPGPILIRIETPGGDAYLEKEKFPAYISLKNNAEGKIIVNSADITWETDLKGGCTKPSRILLRKGQTNPIECKFFAENIQKPSDIFEIQVHVKYGYLLLNSKRVEVVPR